MLFQCLIMSLDKQFSLLLYSIASPFSSLYLVPVSTGLSSPKSERYSAVFFSKYFIILSFTFRPAISLELIYICSV